MLRAVLSAAITLLPALLSASPGLGASPTAALRAAALPPLQSMALEAIVWTEASETSEGAGSDPAAKRTSPPSASAPAGVAPGRDAHGGGTSPGSAASGAARLAFTVEGRRYDLELSPHDALLAALPKGPRHRVRLFRGVAAGMPGSWARVTRSGDRLFVLLWDGHDYLAIEPLAAAASASGAAMPAGAGWPGGGGGRGDDGGRIDTAALTAFRPSPGPLALAGDTRRRPVPTAIAGGDPSPGAALSEGAVPAGTGFHPARAIELAWVADRHFSDRFGSAADAELLARLNVVDGIFAEQLALSLAPVELVVAGAGETLFVATDPARLLDEVEQWKLATPLRRRAALVHLVTGRNLAGDIVGMAALGGACHPRYGVGLTEARRAASVDALIIAHEIGHNLNAPHDGEAGGACAGAPASGHLMSARLGSADDFSACSLQEMSTFLASAGCLIYSGDTDLLVTADLPGYLPLGAPVPLTYTLSARGVAPLREIVVDVDFDDHLTLNGASLAGGLCRPGPGRLTCTLDTLPAGATATLEILASATRLGELHLRLQAFASADPASPEDVIDTVLEVRPATDLSVSVDRRERFTVPARARDFAVTFTNAGPLTARDVTVTVDPAQTTVVGVTGLGECLPEGQVIRCRAGEWAAGAERAATLTLRPSPAPVPGRGVRRETATVSVASAFLDAVPEDDAVSLDLLVVDAIADLAAAGAIPASGLEIGRQTPLTLSIVNAGPDAARDVRLHGAFELAAVAVAGVTDSAAGVACKAGDNTIECSLSSLPAGGQVDLELLVTPIAGARLRLRTAVIASGHDPDVSNDGITLEKAILQAPPGDGVPPAASAGGGGGALGAFTLLSLGAFGLCRRRRCRDAVA
jgi:hypothetical protein